MRKHLFIGLLALITGSALCFLFFRYVAHAETLGTYKFGNYTFTTDSIPDWQLRIYQDMGVPGKTQLLLRTINQLECGHQDGFCMGLNESDAGPFQINRIHGKDYTYSRDMVKKGIAAIEKAKVSGDWSETIQIRDELFRFQAQWTWDRMKRLAATLGKKWYATASREDQVWHQAVWHNGNRKIVNGTEFRFMYGNKAVTHWKILSQ